MVKIEDLVKNAKQGDKEAFSKLILAIHGDLYCIAKSNLNDEDDIQDVLQETFINAYFCIPKLKNDNSFKSWVTKILINECNKIHNMKKRNNQLINNYVSSLNDSTSTSNIDSNLALEEMKKLLTDSENKIFSLYYEEGYTIKQISKKLNINENTIKTRLRSARNKIKHKYKSIIIAIFILFFVTTGAVFGKDIINFIKDMFNLNEIGINNDNILNAIETKDWIQNVDMNYIDINENYKLKVDYLLVDEFNLYIIFNITSNLGTINYNRFTLGDLTLLDENDNIIYDYNMANIDTIAKSSGWKNIISNTNISQELFFLISDEFPKFDKIKFRFSKLILYNSDNGNLQKEEINSSTQEFTIEINEKFLSRTNIKYEVNSINPSKPLNYTIEKAIMSDTGFYVLVTTDTSKINFKMVNEYGEEYNCSKLFLTYNNDNKYVFLITSKIRGDNITIRTTNSEIKLSKAQH